MRREGSAIVVRSLSGIQHALLLVGLVGGMSCAHAPAPPPQELVDARAAYQRAINGPAAKTDPVRLGLASRSLEQAEKAYQNQAKMEDVRDPAYVSLRLTQTAEADAAARILAARNQWQAGQLATLEAQKRAADRARQARTAANTAAATPPTKVLFGFDDAKVRTEASKVLDQKAAAIKSQPAGASEVIVEGHTDSIGDPAYNQDLAERRARAVKEYLVSDGVSASKVTVEAKGPEQPAADNATATGRAQNRRVEIEVLPAGTPGQSPRPAATPPTGTPATPSPMTSPRGTNEVPSP
jgi:outer membrane protein OmpA-like peptidoglycan-associated protein